MKVRTFLNLLTIKYTLKIIGNLLKVLKTFKKLNFQKNISDRKNRYG